MVKNRVELKGSNMLGVQDISDSSIGGSLQDDVQIDVNFEDLVRTAAASDHRAFRVWRDLTYALNEIVQGKRDIETAFNQIDIHDCVKQYTIVPTTWNIDDIIHKFPYGTSQEELFAKLLELKEAIKNNTLEAGRDAIEYGIEEEVDNEVIILKAWGTLSEEGYEIYSSESDIAHDYPNERFINGFMITGGSSIRSFIEDNFQIFYESKEELMKDISKYPGMSLLLRDLSE